MPIIKFKYNNFHLLKKSMKVVSIRLGIIASLVSVVDLNYKLLHVVST
jgi:hypothetical protein